MNHTSDERPMGRARLSGIGRPLDPGYGTNRAVLLLLPALGVAGFARALVGGGTLVEAAAGGLDLLLVGFVAWALTRELAPDEELLAFLAMALAVVAGLLVGDQSVLVPAVLLGAVRVVNRTTGMAAAPVDTVVLVAAFTAGGWLVTWGLAVAGAAGLALDGVLAAPGSQPRRRYHGLVALAVLGATAPRWLAGIGAFTVPAGAWPLLSVLLAGVAAAVIYPEPRSRGDVDGARLSAARVRWGTAVGIVGVGLAVADPTTALPTLYGAGACALCLALGVAVRRLEGAG